MRLINCVIGTAGHIDHGKTALVEAITGINCDRLEEEKKRGITIDIGFARFDLPDGAVVGIVDAPGHLGFIHNMLAGASGIDVGLLVVAADDSVMPQTREHLAILDLLGICKGVVALTKADLVDDDTFAMAHEEVAQLIAGSTLDGAKIIRCSSVTGDGIDQLKNELATLAHTTSVLRDRRLFRLPVDRAFTIKGHGLVVTGSVASGQAMVGGQMEIAPGGQRVKIRRIQNHGDSAKEAAVGTRTALNITGPEKEAIRRGMVICDKTISQCHTSFIARLVCHASSSLEIAHGKSYFLHVHTGVTLCRVFLSSDKSLKAGESCFAQVRYSEPINILYGDRFVLRSSSAKETLGGGMALFGGGPDIGRRGIKLGKPKWEALDEGEAKGLLALVKEKPWGVDAIEMMALFNLNDGALKALIKEAGGVGSYEYKGGIYIYLKSESGKIVAEIEEVVAHCHEKDSATPGIEENRLISSSSLALAPVDVAGYWIKRAVSAGKIEYQGAMLRIKGREVTFTGKDEAASKAIVEAFMAGGLAPPKSDKLYTHLGLHKNVAGKIIRALTQTGELVSLAPGYTLHKTVLASAKEKLVAKVEAEGFLDTGGYRDMLGVGRKTAIEILEYFDRSGVTKRVDNKGKRELR